MKKISNVLISAALVSVFSLLSLLAPSSVQAVIAPGSTPTPPPLANGCVTNAPPYPTWKNTTFAPQTGNFTIAFDATPNLNNMDGVMAFSTTSILSYNNLSAAVRFNLNGFLDVADGVTILSYSALTNVPYSAGNTYHFRFVFNTTLGNYSVFVTPPGNPEVQIASNFNFRNPAPSIAARNIVSEVSNETVCNLNVNGADVPSLPVTNIPAGGNLVVKFGSNLANSTLGTGWNSIIKDAYTDFHSAGPGGTTIVTSNNAIYNFQGAVGTQKVFSAGDKMTVNWFNNSANTITFNPKISFNDPDRVQTDTIGTWYDMTSVTINPNSTATSDYTFNPGTAGTYSLVNVNANYTNNKIILADRILYYPTTSSGGGGGGGGMGITPDTIFPISNGGTGWGNPGGIHPGNLLFGNGLSPLATSTDLTFINSKLSFKTGETDALTVKNLSGSGTKCIQTDNNGLLSLADDICGTTFDISSITKSLFGKSWEISSDGFLTPTTTVAILFNKGFTSNGAVKINGATTITGDTAITGGTTVTGAATVTGATTLNGPATVNGNFTVTGTCTGCSKISGSGQANFIPFWTSATDLGKSILSQDSGALILNGDMIPKVSQNNSLGYSDNRWNSLYLGVPHSGAKLDFDSGGLNFTYNDGEVNVMRLLPNGNVGVGTTSPGSIFSIGSEANSVANFTPATTTFYSRGGINIVGGCFAINGKCIGDYDEHGANTSSASIINLPPDPEPTPTIPLDGFEMRDKVNGEIYCIELADGDFLKTLGGCAH